VAFAGRTEELDLLATCLAGTADAPARTVAVRGEPGIGKTRLLREFGALAEARGWTVAWGRATEFERHVPFGAFTEALDNVLPAAGARLPAALGPDRTGPSPVDRGRLGSKHHLITDVPPCPPRRGGCSGSSAWSLART